MRRCPNNTCRTLLLLILAAGCSNDAAEERREFQALEAAVGMVANAPPEDRGIRLEQLEGVSVRFERTGELKRICVSAYQAFEKASALMETARKSTAAAEAKVAEADQKRIGGVALTAAEETELVALGKKAAEALSEMTGELESAEKLVAACQEERNHLRFEMAGR